MQASDSRRCKPRPVIYKSTALLATDPKLAASGAPEILSRCRSIRNANARAEAVRLEFKEKKQIDIGTPIDGNDNASKEKKYDRRLKMNRQSAAASRVRREAYTKALEAELVAMERQHVADLEHLALQRARYQHLEARLGIETISDTELSEIGEEKEEALVAEPSHVDPMPVVQAVQAVQPAPLEPYVQQNQVVELHDDIFSAFDSTDLPPVKSEALLDPILFAHLVASEYHFPSDTDLPEVFQHPPQEYAPFEDGF